MRKEKRLFITALAALLPLTAFANDDWPAFRGAAGDGKSDSKGVPVKWDEKTNVAWKVPIKGKAWSSPVILGKQVWVTNAPPDGKELHAICLDRDTGAVVRDVKVFDNPKPAFVHGFNSYASCTPVIEDGRLYVHYGVAGTACLDTKTGEVLWQRRDLKCDHSRGPGSSPIVFGDLLYLTFDGFDVQYVAALNKKTGETVWKKDRNIKNPNDDGDGKKAYSTPSVIRVGGKDILVSPSSHATIAFDALTGEEVWRLEQGGMNTACRPLFVDGRLYLTTADGGKQLLAVKPDGNGDITKSNVLWTYGKAAPKRPGPVIHNGLFFMINEGGVLTCLDAAKGTELNKTRLVGNFTASPVFAEGRLYFCDQDTGTSYVVEADKEMKVLATNKLADGCMSSPAIAGKALFIRTKTSLYKIEEK